MVSMVLWLLACSAPDGRVATEPAAHPVTVVGSVTGWDGTGDVAIEACGQGALVDEAHRFTMGTRSDCDLRVVWERDDARAEGRWHPLEADGRDVLQVELPMPDAALLRPLSEGERTYREAAVREAQRNLHQPAPEPTSESGEPSTPPPGV